MSGEDSTWMNYNRDEGPSGEGVEEWQVLQGVPDTAQGGGPVEVQYNNDSCTKSVDTETTSTGASATCHSFLLWLLC